MATAPPVMIEGPVRQPLPHGLFSVAVPRESTDPHWQNGAEWPALPCDPAGGVGSGCDPADPPVITSIDPDSGPTDGGTRITVTGSGFLDPHGTGPAKELVSGALWGEATPFTVYGSSQCSPVGGNSDDAAVQRATAHLLAREEARVEQALWTGDLGNLPSILGSEPITEETILTPVQAVAWLEDFNALNYGSQGVIHVSRGGAAALGGLVRQQGNQARQLRTRVGTPIVAGAGYPNTGPDGAAPDPWEYWAYVTPAVFVQRSEVFTTVATYHYTNDRKALAERTYVTGFDPCPVGGVRFTIASQ